jgi:hypothetical protein
MLKHFILFVCCLALTSTFELQDLIKTYSLKLNLKFSNGPNYITFEGAGSFNIIEPDNYLDFYVTYRVVGPDFVFKSDTSYRVI